MILNEALRLAALGYTTVSLNVEWDNTKSKKSLKFAMNGWQKAQLPTLEQHPSIMPNHNGLAIVTGLSSDVLAIDADPLKPGEDGVVDGVQHMTDMIISHGLPDGVPLAVTGSGGRHYYFSYSKSVSAGLDPKVYGSSKLTLRGIKATIDSRINSNCLIVAPTQYQTPAGVKGYHWIAPLPASSKLPAAPDWLITDLNLGQSRTVATSVPRKRMKMDVPLAITTIDHFSAAAPVLSDFGFRSSRMTRTKEHGSFDFVADRSLPCICCRADPCHKSHEWFGIRLCNSCYAVKSYSQRCRLQVVGFEGSRQLQNILLTPQTDDVYAEVFACNVQLGATPQPIIWTGLRWLQFDNHRWRTVKCHDVDALFGSMSVRLMEQLARWLKSLEADIDLQAATVVTSKTAVKERYKQVLKGLAYCKKHRNQQNVLEMLKTKLFHDVGEDGTGMPCNTTLDSDPNLLGCDNGILDLKTGELRPGRVDDWVSSSVGYRFETTQEGTAFVEQTMQQIFPEEEERKFIQRYAGYCLLGNHPEKHYLLLTDMPGRRSGHNAKTTINKAIRFALGPNYSCEGNSASLYVSANQKDEDACTPGRMRYKGMRFASFEELDPKRRLDTTRLKNLHGGRAVEVARDAYGKNAEEWEWTAKFLITFNIANLPEINSEDHVHLDRMLVMRARSKFLAAEDMPVDPQPNTYEKITDFSSRLEGVKADILAWALKGLSRYWTLRLGQVPPTMRQWKRELGDSQDFVREWVDERLEHTQQRTDFVRRSELYQDYRTHTEEERDKKTAMGKSKFFHKLLLELGEENLKSQIKTAAGSFKDCFSGWRFSPDHPNI